TVTGVQTCALPISALGSVRNHHVDASGRSWGRAMTLVAVAYVVIGILFGWLAQSADADHVRLWRLAAWLASAAVAAAQIGYEHSRPGPSPPGTALSSAGSV